MNVNIYRSFPWQHIHRLHTVVLYYMDARRNYNYTMYSTGLSKIIDCVQRGSALSLKMLTESKQFNIKVKLNRVPTPSLYPAFLGSFGNTLM